MKNNSCLIIIDMQDGMKSEGFDDIAEKIKNLMRNVHFDLVFMTKFINCNSLYETTLNYHAMKNEKDQKLSIEPEHVNYIVHKDGYSGVTNKALHILSHLNIKRAYLCGTDTDACVLATAFRLWDEHIQPVIIEDCCISSGGIDAHTNAIKLIERQFGKGSTIQSVLLMKDQTSVSVS